MHVIGFEQKFIVISLITYLVVFITANIHVKPYQEKMLNVLDSVGLLAIVCFLANELVALLRTPEIYEDDHRPNSYFFELSLVLLPALIYFIIFAYFMRVQLMIICAVQERIVLFKVLSCGSKRYDYYRNIKPAKVEAIPLET